MDHRLCTIGYWVGVHSGVETVFFSTKVLVPWSDSDRQSFFGLPLKIVKRAHQTLTLTKSQLKTIFQAKNDFDSIFENFEYFRNFVQNLKISKIN